MPTPTQSFRAACCAPLVACASAATFAASPPDLTVMEFFHAPTQHYFMTGSPDDQRLLTSPALGQSFLPTGRSFAAWSQANGNRPAGAVAVHRFFHPETASHVFTSNPAEVALLRSLPLSGAGRGFSDEGVAFFALAPSAGRCEAGARPVFRGFNNRVDGNHRYSNELELHAATVSTGFVDEAVAFCSVAIGSDTEIEKRAGTPRPSATNQLTVNGAVSGFSAVASFFVGQQRVDASQARFEGGTAAALSNGVTVYIEGVGINGVLRATEVKLTLTGTAPGSAPVALVDELHGFVTALGSPGTVFVNGSAVDVSHATWVGGTLAQLVVGAEVEVRGGYANGGFVATTVALEDTPRAPVNVTALGNAELDGTVSQWQSVASFLVGNQRVDASRAVFENGTAATLGNGQRVEVRGVLSSGVLVASRVELKRARSDDGTGVATGTPPPPTTPPTTPPPATATAYEATGSISNFVSPSSFTLSGTTIDASAASFRNGSAADLRNGVIVEVKGTQSGGIVRASSVEIKTVPSTPPASNQPADGTEFEAAGAVSGFVSIAAFSLGSASIDASGASFERGSASDLRNGVNVEVRGAWRAGKVIATRVRFQR